MHLYYCLLVSIIYCGVFVDCQHEPSNKLKETNLSGNYFTYANHLISSLLTLNLEIYIYSAISGDSGRTAAIKSDNKPRFCTGRGCEHSGLIIASIFGSLLGMFLLFKLFINCFRRRIFQWPSRSASCLEISKTAKPCDECVFQSGSWFARYLQSGTWHGPNCYSLSFDSSSFKITGSGTDDGGTFSISGAYSKETGRILLIKAYQLDTGDPSKNFGQRVWIRLAWNEKSSQFEGKWCVRTKIYCGRDQFELKYHTDGQVWTVPVAE